MNDSSYLCNFNIVLVQSHRHHALGGTTEYSTIEYSTIARAATQSTTKLLHNHMLRPANVNQVSAAQKPRSFKPQSSGIQVLNIEIGAQATHYFSFNVINSCIDLAQRPQELSVFPVISILRLFLRHLMICLVREKSGQGIKQDDDTHKEAIYIAFANSQSRKVTLDSYQSPRGDSPANIACFCPKICREMMCDAQIYLSRWLKAKRIEAK